MTQEEKPAAVEPRVEFDDSGRSTGIELTEDTNNGGRTTPFDPNRIEVQPRNTTISLLLQRLRRGALDLAPDFQRQAGIWSEANQSRLIESLLLRITLPTIYAAENEDESWAVIDGVQRLTAITRFVDPEAIDAEPLRLSHLEYLAEYDGCTFEDLPGRLQTRILETELVILLIRRGTPEEAKFNIFARINTSGLPLSRQELRHALIPGQARDLLAELAASDAFLTATAHSVSPDRMAEREMCLRFLAFKLTPPEQYTTQNFDDFLRTTMHRINELSEQELEKLRDSFIYAMVASVIVFGPDAFRKQFKNRTRRFPVNKALFEVQAVTLSDLSADKIVTLAPQRDVVSSNFMDLMDDPAFYDSISSGTGAAATVAYRFQSLKDLFQKVLDA
ncbi:DUF262 domain-containing protein [Streptomyces sp. NPDC017868]|uniref:DUF262 domain-containing protein n=1 Tax=Streptomyces sp. NPDC017868 TaxID=3365014 RepID=UPI0037A86CB4